MRSSLFPNERIHSVYEIPFETLAELGVKGVIFDIDNTLVPHGAPATDEIIRLFEHIRETGIRTCLLSNNREKRVRPFADLVSSPFIWLGNKPFPKGYLRACDRIGVKPDEAVFVGDQIFTDIWGANMAGIRSILVDPINPKEEIQIVLKRLPEKLVLRRYENGGKRKVQRIFSH